MSSYIIKGHFKETKQIKLFMLTQQINICNPPNDLSKKSGDFINGVLIRKAKNYSGYINNIKELINHS